MSHITMASTTHGSGSSFYLSEINQTSLLSAPEERKLARRVTDGDSTARDHMVRANLRLVVNLTRGYLGRGLAMEDLISEGNLGLMRAVEGFDAERGIRFSTYAAYWIKQSMRSAVMKQGKVLRLPAYAVTLLAKWRRAGTLLGERLGRTATADEIGGELRLSKRRLEIVAQALRANRLTLHCGFEDEGGAAGQLVDDRGPDTADSFEGAEELEELNGRLDELPEREAEVIRMRFGLDPYAPMTLRQIGKVLGLSGELIRRIERQAISRLMHPVGHGRATTYPIT